MLIVFYEVELHLSMGKFTAIARDISFNNEFQIIFFDTSPRGQYVNVYIRIYISRNMVYKLRRGDL